MEEFTTIEIKIKKETLQKIERLMLHQNITNELNPTRGRSNDYDIDDFITACINQELDKIEHFYELTSHDLGKPFQLKNRFKEFLEEYGWDQKYLCDVTGINKGTISTAVANKNQPSLDYFLRIWVAFGCPPLESILYREP